MPQDSAIHHVEHLNQVNEVTGSQQQLFTSDEPPRSAVAVNLYIKTATGYKVVKGTGSGSAINVVSIGHADSPYQQTGLEDVILVNTTAGPVIINLLAASSASFTKAPAIKDALGTSGTNNITVTPSGADTIETVNAPFIINSPLWSRTFVSNGSNAISII